MPWGCTENEAGRRGRSGLCARPYRGGRGLREQTSERLGTRVPSAAPAQRPRVNVTILCRRHSGPANNAPEWKRQSCTGRGGTDGTGGDGHRTEQERGGPAQPAAPGAAARAGAQARTQGSGEALEVDHRTLLASMEERDLSRRVRVALEKALLSAAGAAAARQRERSDTLEQRVEALAEETRGTLEAIKGEIGALREAHAQGMRSSERRLAAAGPAGARQGRRLSTSAWAGSRRRASGNGGCIPSS